MALGVATFNRPSSLERVLGAAATHLSGVVDRLYVHDDGSDTRHRAAYWRAYSACPTAVVQYDPRNKGVGQAKNAMLRAMLDDGADWMFLGEDDVEPLSSLAVTGYIAACEASGWQHLSFAHHGPLNSTPVVVDGAVTLWPHYVGAWCVYSRECLETCGLFDEGFVNAWEHVEHTLRLARAGFTEPRPWHAADATGSNVWLREIESESVIRPRPDWDENIEQGLAYWWGASPETYAALWGER